MKIKTIGKGREELCFFIREWMVIPGMYNIDKHNEIRLDKGKRSKI